MSLFEDGEHNKWMVLFRTGLGSGILIFMIYQYFFVEPFNEYIFLIPGFLLGFDPTKLLSK